MAVFLATSWITLGVAFVPHYHKFQEYHHRRKTEEVQAASTQGFLEVGEADNALRNRRRRRATIAQKCRDLLDALCDLQAVTGLGLVISGLAQWNGISYYHEQLIACYWYLTLNSFWAARAEYMEVDPATSHEDPMALWAVTIRRVAVLVSSILSIIWQIRNEGRENAAWDDVAGPCYRYLDGTSDRIWIAGEILYCLGLAAFLHPLTRKWLDDYDRFIAYVYAELAKWFQQSKRAVRRTHGSPSWLLLYVLALLRFGLCCTCFFFFAVLQQWLELWAWGEEKFGLLSWFIYLGVEVWNTLDVLSLWLWNTELLDGDERAWGFGQVLPIIMMLSIVISAADFLQRRAT